MFCIVRQLVDRRGKSVCIMSVKHETDIVAFMCVGCVRQPFCNKSNVDIAVASSFASLANHLNKVITLPAWAGLVGMAF